MRWILWIDNWRKYLLKILTPIIYVSLSIIILPNCCLEDTDIPYGVSNFHDSDAAVAIA